MEKQLSVLGYWLGVICLALAVIFRICIAFNINPPHFGSASRAQRFLREFFSWRRIVFSAVDCQLVPEVRKNLVSNLYC